LFQLGVLDAQEATLANVRALSAALGTTAEDARKSETDLYGALSGKRGNCR
jgi:hypothetical protein